jgi:hypothetical protein
MNNKMFLRRLILIFIVSPVLICISIKSGFAISGYVHLNDKIEASDIIITGGVPYLIAVPVLALDLL